MERIVKGIWFPIEIWEAEDLTWNEKILLLEIDSYTARGKDCFISDEYIADLVKVSVRSAAAMVSNLIQKGYIKKTRFDGRKRYLESTIAEQLCKICRAETQDLQTTYNQLLNKSISNDIDDSNKRKAKFVKPTIEEIRCFCEERNNGIDADEFFNFYESKGWVIGKSPMKDWKACIRTWERNRFKSQRPTGRKVSVLENNMAVAEELLRMQMNL
jgi:hypothetical protein